MDARGMIAHVLAITGFLAVLAMSIAAIIITLKGN
jgi:hypothetical protein